MNLKKLCKIETPEKVHQLWQWFSRIPMNVLPTLPTNDGVFASIYIFYICYECTSMYSKDKPQNIFI